MRRVEEVPLKMEWKSGPLGMRSLRAQRALKIVWSLTLGERRTLK